MDILEMWKQLRDVLEGQCRHHEQHQTKRLVKRVEKKRTVAAQGLKSGFKNSLLCLPTEIHLRITNYLDPISEALLQRTCRHFRNIIDIDLSLFRSNRCAIFAFLASLEKDATTHRIPKSFGGSRTNANRFACALCRHFHPREDFESMAVACLRGDMLERDPRERFCGKRHRLARRFIFSNRDAWVCKPKRLCMHCGDIVENDRPTCCCRFCRVTEHDTYTRLFNTRGRELMYAFHRPKHGLLVVREVDVKDVKRDMGGMKRAAWRCEEMKPKWFLPGNYTEMPVYKEDDWY
ncbi:MAG: hypothetical protein M1833_006615 [Piccolia ochrophora]|nr:MAG: hypothetical protein M1833_006615 [Piccolia ochrophora]